jgi:hypothetical protein
MIVQAASWEPLKDMRVTAVSLNLACTPVARGENKYEIIVIALNK